MRTSFLPFLFPAFIACGSTEPEGNFDLGSASGGQASGGSFASGATQGASGGNMSTGGTSASGGTGGDSTSAPTEPSYVSVVAHQDDDLLFINPSIARALAAKQSVSTIYLTSGDADLGVSYVQKREEGIFGAYAQMAQVPSHYDCGVETFAGQSLRVCSLQGADLQLYFFRLPDGFADGGDPQSLLKLWTGNIATSADVTDATRTWSREQILSALGSIYQARQMTSLATTDFTFRHYDDHSDHEIAALFALASSADYPHAHELTSYRTYNTSNETANLSPSDAALVQSVFETYAACDAQINGCSSDALCGTGSCTTVTSPYSGWFDVHYGSARLASNTSYRISQAGACILGSSASLGTCSAGAATGDDTLHYNDAFQLQVGAGPNCIAATELSAGSAITTVPCQGGARTQFALLDQGQIVLAAAPEGSNAAAYSQSYCLNAQGSALTLAHCSSSSSQNFSFFSF